ncbi:hypothetical protein [Aeromonas veronii]|uniref:hypothetical protein n=1 Tax=Aeromonas veronii TaxID=654 RepID=UPI00217DF9B4|nr:hypothetical protein [Aeromonas veronii]
MIVSLFPVNAIWVNSYGLIPEFIRQDFHLDLLSWQKGGHLTLIMIGVAAAMAGVDWLVHRYRTRTKRQQPKGPVGPNR